MKRNASTPIGVENMIMMDNLTEESILNNLEVRYKAGHIYVCTKHSTKEIEIKFHTTVIPTNIYLPSCSILKTYIGSILVAGICLFFSLLNYIICMD